ncbi:hypothetical protein V5O48_010896 [Marasmius crinis-equi]|uniref:Cyclin N-terminal domain-containing protein n=1 Tax=Marasmius crinis-equi TaxID=585013 RepID=A0ABR3F763_9AGAR
MIHPASLVDQSLHSSRLLRLLSQLQANKMLTEYTIKLTTHVVDFATLSMPSESPRIKNCQRRNFVVLVEHILSMAEVTTPVALATLVYIRRSKRHLNIAMRQWALERVFLGSLILAYKYLNDRRIRNVDWARCSGIFGLQDIGRIEREFLDVLDWDLRISETDLLDLFSGPREGDIRNEVLPEGNSQLTPATTSSCTVKQKKMHPKGRIAPKDSRISRKNKRPTKDRRVRTRRMKV